MNLLDNVLYTIYYYYRSSEYFICLLDHIQTSASDKNLYSVYHLIYQFPVIKVQKLSELCSYDTDISRPSGLMRQSGITRKYMQPKVMVEKHSELNVYKHRLISL